MDLTKFHHNDKFVKEFALFSDGVQELAAACHPFQESVSRAMKELPVPDMLITLGDALQIQEMFLMVALINQAYHTQSGYHVRYIMAKACNQGFTYRTKSGFVYGWRRTGKEAYSKFRFFVALAPLKKQALNQETMDKLLALGWRKVVRKEIKQLGLQQSLSLSVE